MELPIQFLENMQELLGGELPAYLESLQKSNYFGLRANTLKIEPQKLINGLALPPVPVPWCDTGFLYPKEARLGKHPYYYAGLYYLQEPSAMAPASLLPVSPGEKVLDLCAAPGGKSTYIGAKLAGKGVLVSNDISTGRIKALVKNIELSGIANAIVLNEQPKKMAEKFQAAFHKILVDAPCSGEGMFRKDKAVIKSWEKNGPGYYQPIQKEILAYAAKMLLPGGMILYSTCTFSPEENEKVIADFLSENKDFHLAPLPKIDGFDDGHPEWADGNDSLTFCKRLWPHKIQGEGHFLALLEKEGAYELTPPVFPETFMPQELKSFLDQNITKNLPGVIEILKDMVYLVPDATLDLSGLRVARSGHFLGHLKKNRFEPSQAFAMGLKVGEVSNTISLSIDDPAVMNYLKGNAIEAAKEGWHLVCLEDYPLGWGKVSGGRFKNKILPAWRWE